MGRQKGATTHARKRDNYIGECDVCPDCLQCPLPMCKHDDPAGYHRWKKQTGQQPEPEDE